jgi:FkbM family methyltransferase
MMRLIKKIKNLFRYAVLRDSRLVAVRRWFRDSGDTTLRVDYPLNERSVVFDLGGYHGDFAAAIYDRYGCTVHVFEPVPSFYEMCLKRFQDNPKIICHKFGLSDKTGSFMISDAADASSISASGGASQKISVEVVSCDEFLASIDTPYIDLLKINIEGGEYEVLPLLIKTGLINNINHLQIQFHDFISNAREMREIIRMDLSLTHNEVWCYEFVWEGWCIKG